MHNGNTRQMWKASLRKAQTKIWELKVEEDDIQMAGHGNAACEGVYLGFDGW